MICIAENCQKEAVYQYCQLCNSHYQRWKIYGRLETVCYGQSFHPLYKTWHERKQENLLCDNWKSDFRNFLADVGEKPGDDYWLVRPNKKELFGPTNFHWHKVLTLGNIGKDRAEYQRRKRKADKLVDKDRYRRWELKKSFGITIEQYDEMLWRQNGVCAICKQKEVTKDVKSGEIRSLAVDHCHKSNAIRGLLCQRCNRVLGKIQDSIEILDSMRKYLLK